MQTNDQQLGLDSEIDSPIEHVAPKRTLAGTLLNVATGGGWGALKWIGRRVKGKEGKQTFFGKVAALVVSHAVYSLMIGTIGIWGLLKGVAYVLAGVLALMGWETKPPAVEGEKPKISLAGAAEAVEGRYERMKAKLEAEAEQRKLAWEEKEKKWKDGEFAREVAKRREDAEREIERRKDALEARERALLAKAKAEIKEHTPSPWELMFGSSRPAAAEPPIILAGTFYRAHCDDCGAPILLQPDTNAAAYRMKCYKCGLERDYRQTPHQLTADELRAIAFEGEEQADVTCPNCRFCHRIIAENTGTLGVFLCQKCKSFIDISAASISNRATLAERGKKPAEDNFMEVDGKRIPVIPFDVAYPRMRLKTRPR